MNNICRLITTLDCHRRCYYCCNKHDSIKSSWKDVLLKDVLGKYDTYVITGGEPLMQTQIDRTLHVMQSINEHWFNSDTLKPQPKIYVYTSLCTRWLPDVMKEVDGITYSMHIDCSDDDIRSLQRFQTYISFYDDKSYYLNIDSTITKELPIIPSLWNRIQSFKPLDNCPVPQGEDLCRLVEVF